MVIGGFAEGNKGLTDLVNLAAYHAGRSAEFQNASPFGLGNDLGPDKLALLQFRRALGVQFAKNNAKLNFQRIHMVGRTPAEARALATGQWQPRSWNPNTDCPSRFSANYSPDGPYQAWYEFRHSSSIRPRRTM